MQPPTAPPPRPVAQPVAPTAQTPQPLVRPTAVPLGEFDDDHQAPSGPLQIDLPPIAATDDEDAMPPIAVPQQGRVNLRQEPPARPAQQQQPVPGITTTLPRAPGRYMCRWCGMESDTADRCSWCRRDMRNLPPMNPGKAGTVTITHQGQKKSVRQPVNKRDKAQPGPIVAPPPGVPVNPPPVAPPPAAPQPQPGHPGAPQLGQFQAQKSKYYADKVFDPISQTHYDPDTGEAEVGPVSIEVEEAEEKRDQFRQVFIYTAGLAVAAIAGYFLVGAMPSWYLLFLALINLGAGFALPLLRVVGFRYDEDDDVGLAGALFLILGPYAGTAAYIVLSVLRGGGNPAMIAVGLSYIFLRLPMDLARGFSFVQCFSSPMVFTPPIVLAGAQPDWGTHIFAHIMIFACFFGWFFADMFRKPDA